MPRHDATTDSTKGPARVVYSALIGGYENLVPRPECSDPEVDFVLFTDSKHGVGPAGWRTVLVSPRFPTDPVRSARFLKIVGHPELDKYEETLWVDNRVLLRANPSSLFQQLAGFDMALPTHSFRDNLTQEFGAVISSGYDDPRRVRHMFEIAKLARVDLELPFWTGMMLRKRTPEVAECMREWFDLLLLTSRRDQLSINTALANHPLSVRPLEIDNLSSEFHDWVPQTHLNRQQSIQAWRPMRRSIGLRAGDGLRSSVLGRKAARVISAFGFSVPTLPR